MNKIIKKVALALICCLTINSSSGAIAIAQTKSNQGDNVTPIIQEVENNQDENTAKDLEEDKLQLPQEGEVTTPPNNQEADQDVNNTDNLPEQPTGEEQLPEEPVNEGIVKEEVSPAIPEDVKNAILSGNRSTLYDTTLDIDTKRKITETTGEANKLTLSKIAKNLGNDKYEIQLDVTGNAQQQQVPTADIVIVMDRTRSMAGDKLNKTKIGVNNFIDKVLGVNNTANNIGISIVPFAKSAQVITASEDTNLEFPSNPNDKNYPFTNDAGTLKQLVNKIEVESNTNIEAAMNRAKQILSKSSAQKKYVVFFTDGEPNYYCGTIKNNMTTLDKNRILFGYENTNNGSSNARLKAKTAYDSLIGTNSDVKFYTAALFDSGTNSTTKKFLYSIQNIAKTEKEYTDNYYIENVNQIDNLFQKIATEIKVDINETIAKNININDTLTKYFNFEIGEEKLPENFRITDMGSNELSINSGIKYDIKVDIDTNKISINNINEIKQPGISIKFTVDAKDPYFFGENIPTNTVADINFKDPLDPNKTGIGEFPIPTINIEPRIGQIDVTKNVVGTTEAINDTFSILINGQNVSYNMDVKSGENNKQTMKFILKGPNTNINDTYLIRYLNNNNNEVNKLGFVTAGKYNVKEIVPMNYKLKALTINEKENEEFTLDKANKNISIKLTNELVNQNYFFDKVTKNNKFKLTIK